MDHFRHWHHSPLHKFIPGYTYMITAGTYHKHHFFNSNVKLELLENELFAVTRKYKWDLRAWAILSNHYHFVSMSPEKGCKTLKDMIQELHSKTARALNAMDNAFGRRIWFEYWDTCLTYENSYFARINYVNYNPFHHKIVNDPANYPYSSAAWFKLHLDPAIRNRVESYKFDKINVIDNF